MLILNKNPSKNSQITVTLEANSIITKLKSNNYLIDINENNIKNIDILKIDVEGYEHNVIKGAKKTIEKFRPIFFIEIDDENLKHFKTTAKNIINEILNLNYQVYSARTLELLSIDSDFTHIDIICKPIK